MDPIEKDVRENWNNLLWWNKTSESQLSEEFIRKYKDKLDWNNIIIYQKLNENFIEENKNLINWNLVGLRQILSEEFIEKYKDRLSWYDITRYQVLSEQFIWNNRNKNIPWINIFQNQQLTENFIEKCLKTLNPTKEEIWNSISYFQILSEKFIIKYKNKVNWYSISLRQPFITKYNDEIIKCNINKSAYNKNYLSKLYENNKNWFIGYIYLSESTKDKKLTSLFDNPINTTTKEEYIGKVKVYWKDLVMTNKIKKYELIRTIKTFMK